MLNQQFAKENDITNYTRAVDLQMDYLDQPMIMN